MVLPSISSSAAPSGAKPTFTGTYVAEQTSKESFDLLAAISPRKSSPKLRTRSRKTKVKRVDLDGPTISCAVLPALKTIEPLLLQAGEGFFSPGRMQAAANRAAHVKAAEEAAMEPALPSIAEGREAEIQRVTQRLHRAENGGAKTDAELLAWLTRPRSPSSSRGHSWCRSAASTTSGFSARNSAASTPGADAKESPATERVARHGRTTSSGSKSGRRLHATHYDLFASVAPSTEATRSSSSSSQLVAWNRSRSAGVSTSARERASTRRHRLKLSSIDVLPENAVDAFFEAEEKAVDAETTHSTSARMSSDLSSARSQQMLALPKQNDGAHRQSLQQLSPRSPLPPAGTTPISPGHEERRSVASEEDVIDAVGPSKKIDVFRREACDAVRIIVFGAIGNERETQTREREKIYHENCGTYEKVIKLWKVFGQIDEDHSGRIDILELKAYAEKINQKKSGEKASNALLGKKSLITVDDFMRLIWPCAQTEHLKKMNGWIKDYTSSIRRVKTPPVLPDTEFEGLIENFRFFDADRSGTVSLDELVASGLIDEDEAKGYLSEWDHTGEEGTFNEMEFCRMMCPAGYRAYAEAPVATDKDGNQIILEEGFGWRLKESSDLSDE